MFTKTGQKVMTLHLKSAIHKVNLENAERSLSWQLKQLFCASHLSLGIAIVLIKLESDAFIIKVCVCCGQFSVFLRKCWSCLCRSDYCGFESHIKWGRMLESLKVPMDFAKG